MRRGHSGSPVSRSRGKPTGRGPVRHVGDGAGGTHLAQAERGGRAAAAAAAGARRGRPTARGAARIFRFRSLAEPSGVSSASEQKLFAA